ncbi:MAG TPA: DUF4157 domain-containing protein, partial [Chitinophagaceae bacterium]
MMEAVKHTKSIRRATAAAHAVSSKTLAGKSAIAAPLFGSTPIQLKSRLSVNKPGDAFEREADSVADKVMRMHDARASKPPSAIKVIQRKEMDREKLIQKKGVPGATISPLKSKEPMQFVQKGLSASKGMGQPLAPHIRSFMGRTMGADFSKVRIHTGEESVGMNKALHAHAFTHGSDIYFNRGKYDPDSTAGKHLLAHELTHVLQQGAADRIQKKEAGVESIRVSGGVSSDAVQLKSAAALMTADPAYQGVIKKVKDTTKKAKHHEPANKKVKEAQHAAKPPANEKASKAKDKKTDEMDQQQPGKFDEEKFKAALREKIAALKLNTLEEAEDFKKNNGAGAVKGDMQQQVTDEKGKATSSIENKTKEAPNPSKETGKEVGPKPVAAPGVSPPAVSPVQAAPKPVPAAEISLDKGSKDLDKQMGDAKVTEKQLKKSNEPKFQKALDNKNAAQKDAKEAPVQLRKDEKGILTQSQLSAGKTSKAGLAAMSTKRKGKMSAVLAKQEEARMKDEQARAKVAADIEQKFAATKTDVENILSQLDKDVNALFDQGIASATKAFEDYVDREVRAFKIDRYLNQIGGSLLWGYDLLKGPPDEVNEIYKRGKAHYIRLMDGVINKAAALVVRQLNAAKKRINAGKQEIKTYVASLPKNLQKVGADAAKKVQSQFEELESSINNKQNELIDSLADKYKAGVQNVDKKIEAMKEANKGLIDRAKEAISEVIDAIIEFKNMIKNVLAKAAEAIDLIIEDPIGFLSNLIAGVKGGIQGFMSRIGEHLKAGLMGWLFGTLASAGIQLPKTFDLKGILSLILQVLGLTYANIRARAVNILGEKVVGGLEKVAEVFIIVKNEGIGGLWRFIKEKVEDLKDTVLNSIKEFVIQKIVTAGITWIISLLNPASAFIKACKLIYDVIMFFVTRAKQIVELINAVINSVVAIAKGAINVASTAVENALAKALPVALGFLASLLGLDGISDKIKNIIAKIQAPINAAIDWVIHKAVALVKAIGGLFTGGKGKEEKKSEYGPEKQAKIDAGIIFMKQEEAKYLKNGKMTKADADKVASVVKTNHKVFSSFNAKVVDSKVRFVYTASAESLADEVEVVVEGETYFVCQVEDNKVQIRLDDESVRVPSGASPARTVELLTKFTSDRETAVKLFNAIQKSPKIKIGELKTLLLQFARPATAGADPVEFLREKLKKREGTHAAFARIPGPERRQAAVNLGVKDVKDESPEQRVALSEFAQVFYEAQVGDWESRQVQSKAESHDQTNSIEYIWKKGGTPKIISLGVVEVEKTSDIVIRIVEATPETQKYMKGGLDDK